MSDNRSPNPSRVLKPLSSHIFSSLLLVVFVLVVLPPKIEADVLPLQVNLTILGNTAVQKGAVCLDGTPPGYYLHRGFGSGRNSWLVQLGGGGWCNNVTNCVERSKYYLGSSKAMFRQFNFTGILNNRHKYNPDFYDWNRVRIQCCDGASFTGDSFKEINSSTKLYFRGARIFDVVIQKLLAKGLRKAENAILTGCSAGGLSVFHHCDNFTSRFSKTTKVKCVADAGYFINSKSISGARVVERYFDEVVTLHGSANNLAKSCTSKMKPSLCFFPENVAQGIKTPLFILNSAIDRYQIMYHFIPEGSDNHSVLHDCWKDITNCTDAQLKKIQEFGSRFVEDIAKLENSSSRGLFINSCSAHCQYVEDRDWFGSHSPMLHNKTIAKAVGDWFFDRTRFQEIGGPYPFDPISCRH